MKTLLIIVSLFIVTNVKAQDSLITYKSIVDVPGLDRIKLFDKIKLWSIDGFEYTKGAMQIQDREAGIFAFTATYKAYDIVYIPKSWGKKKWLDSTVTRYDYDLKLKILVKDNKYKYEITDINYYSPYSLTDKYQLTSSDIAPWGKVMFSSSKNENEKWKKAKIIADKDFNKIVNSLYQYVINKKEEW